MGNLKRVTEAILRLDPVYAKAQTEAARAGDQNRYVISGRPGEAIFMKACSNCHSIGGGDRIGPDLDGVTERRDHDWLMQVLIDAQKLRNEGDPLFTALDAQYPNVLMPYLNLSETDAGDVLSYIERRSAQKRAGQNEASAAVAESEAHVHDDQVHDGHSHGEHEQTHDTTAHTHGGGASPNG